MSERAPTRKTVRVRIPVVVGSLGDWAVGTVTGPYTPYLEVELVDNAKALHDDTYSDEMREIYWIEADAPIPQPTETYTIPGTVMEGGDAD